MRISNILDAIHIASSYRLYLRALQDKDRMVFMMVRIYFHGWMFLPALPFPLGFVQ